VVIADIVSQGPGWIAIHNEVDGNMGPAIGQSPVPDGQSKDVVVQIDPAQATPVMYAMLHVDAGAVGTYEFPGPDVPAMLNGQMIAPPFNTTIGEAGAAPSGNTPSISVSDQEVTEGKVTVERVVSAGQGWVDIHTQGPDGEPAGHIGFTAVQDGVNENVVVTIDPSLATPVLYAMLHVDAGEAGVYELPEPDVAMVVDGVRVVVPFSSSGTPLPAELTTPEAQPTAAQEAGTTPEGGTTTPEAVETPAAGGGETAVSPTAAPDVETPSITVSNQQIQNGQVIVDEVVSDGDMWLVIHPENPDGSMGNMIGFALVPDGFSTNVPVDIDVDRATPVLYAMLHVNETKGNSPVFPGADVPVLVNGQMVAPAFTLLGTQAGDVQVNVSNTSSHLRSLVDAQGMSLYIFLNDTSGRSNCAGECLEDWQPLLATGRLLPGTGVPRENLGVIIRPDGSRQVTYLGSPLYYYTGDQQPGDLNGQGLDGLWFLATP
jgi:predicted lipoprotein with Yx(FWY)xxD motif